MSAATAVLLFLFVPILLFLFVPILLAMVAYAILMILYELYCSWM